MRDMKIKGENLQGDIGRTLCVQESLRTRNGFFQWCLEKAREDEDFFCAMASVNGNQYAFIVTEHADNRGLCRTNLPMQYIRSRALELLTNSFVGAAVTASPILINDQRVCVPEVDDGAMTTAVVDEETGLIYIFQAGFQFIRLVTIWPVRSGVFFHTPDTAVIKLRADGFVENKPEAIPEVALNTRRRGKSGER